MNKQRYIQIPVTDYNRLPIFETNVMDTIDDVKMMYAMVSGLRNYADYLEQITKERETEILDRMACYEASKHFEDYMNKPITSTKYVRDEIKKNHFANMFGTMLTPESGTRRETHADVIYFDTDSVIDGTDKTPCMYDYAEDIINGRDDIAICKAAHKKSDGDCALCTEPCCSQSGVNNK